MPRCGRAAPGRRSRECLTQHGVDHGPQPIDPHRQSGIEGQVSGGPGREVLGRSSVLTGPRYPPSPAPVRGRAGPTWSAQGPSTPKLTTRQQAELVRMHATGDYTIAELMEVFSVGRATVYRVLERAAVSPAARAEDAAPASCRHR
ncbi:helix-turn-helix domain-containing protein [Nonomuraea polychroma]|uniref:helix-turn-helix domain-containing protein n=1 Tax=Nonomuraea polychroma TaxID=46176 RepID=UPI003D8E0EF7